MTRITESETTAERLSEILKAVAHPLRLRIQRARGLVAANRENGFARYRLAEPALRDLIGCMERCRH